jgi:TRAP-type C4-dicarboxylate transport system permease small subunit
MDACGTGAALLFGAIAVVIVLDVVTRNAGLGALPWALEVSEYALPLATFLAAPWVLFHGAHVRVELLLTALPPAPARALGVAADALGLAVCLVFLHFGIVSALDAWRIGALVIKTLVFPEWWLLAPVPLCSALLAIEFGRRIAAGLGRRRG